MDRPRGARAPAGDAKLTPATFLLRFARAGFHFDRFAAEQVAVEGSGGPEATLAAFRAAVPRETAPPGPKVTWLGEVLVHGEDIRRPLGIEHRYPLPEVARAIRFHAGSNTLIGGRDRVAGLTLRATDTDLTLGSGPVVEGPAMSLLLAGEHEGRSVVRRFVTPPAAPVLVPRPPHRAVHAAHRVVAAWAGPATKPSIEIDMWQVVRVIGVETAAPVGTHRRRRPGLNGRDTCRRRPGCPRDRPAR